MDPEPRTIGREVGFEVEGVSLVAMVKESTGGVGLLARVDGGRRG